MKYSILIFNLFIFSSILAGGPWLNKKKKGFFQIQSTFPSDGYSRLFLENGTESILKRPVLDYTVQAYLEYGISDKIDVISVLPYKYVATENSNNLPQDLNTLDAGSLSGLGNFKLGFKHRLLDKKTKMAASIQSSFNTVNKDLQKGLVTGYQTNSIGTYFHIGRSFNSNLYSFIDAGYNLVSNNFSDYLDVHYEIGYQIKPSLWTAFTLDLRESLKNGDYINNNLRQTALYTNNQEYFAFGIKASYELKNKTGFNVASFGAFSGNYVAKISTFSIGIYKKW